MLVTCADGGSGAARAQVDGCQVVAHLGAVVAKGCGIALPEPSVVAYAPAFGGAVVQNGAHVVMAATYGRGCAARTQVDGCQVVAH